MVWEMRLARELEISQDEAGHYIERYFARYAGVQSYLERTVAEARERGYVVTLLGRRRYLPEISAVASICTADIFDEDSPGFAYKPAVDAMLRTLRRSLVKDE